MGIGQFSPHILSLQKKTNTVRACERIGILQQLGQGSQSPRCDDIENLWRQIFQTGIADRHPRADAFCRGLEKGALLGRGLMKGDCQIGPKHGQDKGRKAGS